MTLKKKILTASSAAILSLTLAFNAVAASVPFTDISDIASKDKIISLQERGYVSGTGNNRFSPASRINTAQTIQLLVKAFDLNLQLVRFAKEPKATDYFTKAHNDAWYANALITASVNGVEIDKEIDMSKDWTREEFTNILISTMEKHFNLPMLKIKPVDIKDTDQINVEFSGAIQRALIYGVVKLDEEGNFYPKDKLTRAEAAEQIYNALEYLKAHQKVEG
ncbi:MAG: S-layer y protein [Eubacterium sp.]|jgi:hypothetical protein|nr:S-layer y protein [Eubacterium sp.]